VLRKKRKRHKGIKKVAFMVSCKVVFMVQVNRELQVFKKDYNTFFLKKHNRKNTQNRIKLAENRIEDEEEIENSKHMWESTENIFSKERIVITITVILLTNDVTEGVSVPLNIDSFISFSN